MATAKTNLGRSVLWLLTAAAVVLFLLAPPLIRGVAAQAWVRYYAEMDQLPRPRRTAARALIEKTDLAVRNLAPLPQAAGAAFSALETAQRAEQSGHDRETALLIYRGVRATCARARESVFGGPGFAVLEARAAALEAAAARTGAK